MNAQPAISFGPVERQPEQRSFAILIDGAEVGDAQAATGYLGGNGSEYYARVDDHGAPSWALGYEGDLSTLASESKRTIKADLLARWADSRPPAPAPTSPGTDVVRSETAAPVAASASAAVAAMDTDQARDAATLFAALAPNTRAAYKAGWDQFAAAGLPLTDRGLRDFVQRLHDAGASPGTIRVRAAAVRHGARALGQPLPTARQGSVATAAMTMADRDGADRRRGQAAGAGWAKADTAARLAEKERTSKGLRDAAIVAVASDALLRVSEVAGLDVADIEHRSDGSARLTVRRSKTDQNGQGKVLFIGRPTARRVSAWARAASIESGPLFRALTRGGRCRVAKGGQPKRMDARSVRAVIVQRLVDAGAEGRVSGHSLRIGSARDLVRMGADLPELMQAGRWKKAETPAHYVEAESAGRGAVARLRYGAA